MLEIWGWFCENILLQKWFSPAALIIGGLWALYTYSLNSARTRRSIELINQPIFTFHDSMNGRGKIPDSVDSPNANSTERPIPDFCVNPNCSRLHWFDVKNEGNFPAQNFSISVVLNGENNFRQKLSNRVIKQKHLQAKESMQYALTVANNISDKYLNIEAVGHPLNFYIFIQYKSEYTKVWHRRVYQLDATKIDNNTKNSCSNWAKSIEFYSISEHKYSYKKKINILKTIRAAIIDKKQLTLEQYADNWVDNFSIFNQDKHIFG